VPATESLARSIGDRAIDFPNERSLHEFPTPKLGGLAVLGGGADRRLDLPALGPGDPIDPRRGDRDHRGRVIDDLVDLPAGVKLLGQTGAAIIPVASGVSVDTFTLRSSAASTPPRFSSSTRRASARSTSARC